MRSVLAWSDKVPERNGEKFVVQDLAFRPDGLQMVAAVGTRVMVYDAIDGNLLHSLKGHKANVYCVDYSHDGKRFASGGADNVVIIWTDKAEGILKYTHNESIQKLVYNPVSQCLVSCTASDFGLWSPEQKSVAKHKVISKILSACWTRDGQYIAIGMFNGLISIRDKQGGEKVLIERPSQTPVWAMCWSSSSSEENSNEGDILVVGTWGDRMLTFYQMNGNLYGKPRKLNFNPTSISIFSPTKNLHNNKFLLIAGSNRKASLYTRDGIFLSNICEQENWIWSIRQRPKAMFSSSSSSFGCNHAIAIGCEDGTICMYAISFHTVHGIYQERYAYRENMTDVIVQHLMTDQKVRIKTKDCVKKISVYRDRLAIQLSDRIIIYELASNETTNSSSYDMHYRVKERIQKDLPCSLLVVTSEHFILCQKQKLQQFDFHGKKQKEWEMETCIRYLKVLGGKKKKESFLVGLKNGKIFQIFINNSFPFLLLGLDPPPLGGGGGGGPLHSSGPHHSSIACLDLSQNKEKLAIVDEKQKGFVYDLKTKQLVDEEEKVNSVAWNTEFEDMLCFGTSNGQLKIKTINTNTSGNGNGNGNGNGFFSVHLQKMMQGFVVGFTRNKVFCLNALAIQTIDIPQSAPLYRYLEQNEFTKAYQVSCLGVTEADWRLLAWEALKNLNFDIARRAFIRIRDVKYIELVNSLETKAIKNKLVDKKEENYDPQELSATTFADPSASTISSSTNEMEKTKTKNKSLLQAEIMAYQGKFQLAAKMFTDCGEPQRAIQMFVDLRMWEDAKKFATQSQSVDIKQLVQDQAKWAEEVQDWRAAAEMYSASGNLLKAVEIMGQRGWYDDLMDIVQKLDASISSDTKILGLCADFFLQAEKFKLARDVFLKIGDFDALLKMHIRLQDWEEAVRLATKHKDRVKNAVELWVPYAEWLTGQDRFDDALEAYTKAKRMDHCSRLLKQLIENAVFEKRFKDASYYHWRLAEQLLVSISTAACESKENDLTDAERKTIEEAKQNELYSELYYAYAMVFSFTDEPFTTLLPESLFHASRFLLNKLTKNVPTPPGMSLRNIYYTLGQHAVQLESYKLARQAFEKLLSMKLRPEWQSVVELTSMTLQTKPYADREDLLPVDYRSSTVNPLLNPNNNGDVCVTSGHPFVRSFVSFENLPLVEFQPAPGISDEKAEKLILAHPSTFQADGKSKNSGSRSESKGWKEVEEKGGAQTLRFDDNDNGDEFEEDDGSSRNKSGSSGKNGVDLFEAALNRQANYVGGAGHRSQIAEYKVLQIDEKTLASLNPNDIFIVKYPTKALRYKFYKNMIPEIKVHFSPHCRRFFHEEDFEFEYLKTGVCPCCRLPEMDTPENNPTTTATNTQNSSNKKSNPINKGDLNNNHQP